MDLVAGDAPDILMVIGLDDLAALDDRGRFVAHLALGSGHDPTRLDLFAQAARTVTGWALDGTAYRQIDESALLAISMAELHAGIVWP